MCSAHCYYHAHHHAQNVLLVYPMLSGDDDGDGDGAQTMMDCRCGSPRHLDHCDDGDGVKDYDAKSGGDDWQRHEMLMTQ